VCKAMAAADEGIVGSNLPGRPRVAVNLAGSWSGVDSAGLEGQLDVDLDRRQAHVDAGQLRAVHPGQIVRKERQMRMARVCQD
jgi:hypothetical protein